MLWKTVWFAKNDDQKKIDEFLKKFAFFFDVDITPTNFFEDFSLLILYDQISRNIFRNSEKAYEYDEKARKLAGKYRKNLKELPLHNILTILICFLHSESIDDQKYVGESISWLKTEEYSNQYNEIIDHLELIHKNHYERIMLFGRIPERNKYLGRTSKEDELVYIKSVDASK